MKKIMAALFAVFLTVAVVNPFTATASEGALFNEVGVKEGVSSQEITSLQYAETRNLANVTSDWSTFPAKKAVPLTKEWSINFSGIATKDKIDAIVIERNSQFIPVTITIDNSKYIKVKPKESFSGNSNYVLKILLANGKKYKMDFSTVAAPRPSDIEPNNTHLSANEVLLNETVTGTITKGDVDYFRVEVPSYGTLNVNMKSTANERLMMQLYGSDGNNNYAMTGKSDFTQGSMSEGLMPGTYYIRVAGQYRDTETLYELETNFVVSTFENDNGASSHLQAPLIPLNQSFTGHIGYFSDYKSGNYRDYFKVEVKKIGKLSVDLTGYNAAGMSVSLYGSDGDNKYALASKTNFTQGTISQGVLPGTYYIRVSTHYTDDYSQYKLAVNFDESDFKDDNGVGNYLFAPNIALNDSFTGHIGYLRDVNEGNTRDYFKVEVNQSGVLNLELTGYDQVGLSLFLYGDKGHNEQPLASKNNFTQGSISKALTPGTYYVGVRTYYNDEYSKYRLKTTFTGDVSPGGDFQVGEIQEAK